MSRPPRDRRWGIFPVLLAAAALAAVPLLPAHAAGLSGSELRGKRIYTQGQGAMPIFAFLEGPGIRGQGSGFPCIQCHGEDGKGRTEGGVRSADITHAVLTKAYNGVRPSGRAHPPYDDGSLKAAITGGLDPARNDLNKAHPRYEMEEEDLRDLVSYLKVLGREPVPGVSDNEVRVGILLPGQGPLSEAGDEVRRLLAGRFREVNSHGGLFGRALALVPVVFDPGRAGASADAVRAAMEKEEVFCFVGNLGIGAEDEAARYLAERKVPVLAPLLLSAEGSYGTDRYTFHIFAGVRDQARVMVDFLAEGEGGSAGRLALLFPSDGSGEEGAGAAREQAGKYPLSIVAEFRYPPGKLSAAEAVERLRRESPDTVLFFGNGSEALAFLKEADRREWRPRFLAPASRVGGALFSLPRETAESVFLSSPVAPPDPASRETRDFLRLSRQIDGGGRHRSFQLLAYAGAKLLEEGLKRSGKAVTRERFVGILGSLYNYPMGVTPPLSYNENRRVGARGAAMIRMDAANGRILTAAPWREPK